MIYCDDCGKRRDYPITPEKKKGECQLCHRKIGPMNIMGDDDFQHLINNISKDEMNIDGFQVKQVAGFIPGMETSAIEPGMNAKLLTKDCILFYGAERNIVLANKTTGKRIQITF